MDMSPAEMVANYIKLRDYKKRCDDEYKKGMERVNAAMTKLECELLNHLTENEINNLSCDDGTVYKNMQVSATVADPIKFREWVLKNKCWDALDLKANKTFVKEYAEEHGDIPPGIKFTQVQTVGVRRS